MDSIRPVSASLRVVGSLRVLSAGLCLQQTAIHAVAADFGAVSPLFPSALGWGLALSTGVGILVWGLCVRKLRGMRVSVAESVRLKELLLEHGAECAVLMDTQGRVCFVSDSGRVTLEASGNTALRGEVWRDWWLPEWRVRAEEGVKRCLLGESVALDLAMGGGEGRGEGEENVQWWEVILLDLGKRSGGRVLALMRNVSSRRRAEMALSEKEELFGSFLDNSPAMVYIKDGQGRYLRVNRVCEEIQGRGARELIGRRDFEIRGLPGEQQIEQMESEILRSGVPRRVVEEFSLPNGETVHWRVLRFPLRLSSGKLLLGAIGVDVTRAVRSESLLQDARDSALQSARLKSEFLANMSHEIRTPMNGIIGMAGLLLNSGLNERQKDFAQTISASADALLNILNDILDFSKIEAGMLTFEEIEFDPEEVLFGSAQLFAERAAHKGLELAVLLDPWVPGVLLGDPGRLRQILVNLLGNALKFTTKGEVVVECALDSSLQAPQGETTLLFKIRDTGIGISAEAQQRLFQAFTQADGSTTRRHGGTGLGLAISRELVQRMGGEIGVRSKPGEGASFWFTARFRVTSPHSRPSVSSLAGWHIHVLSAHAPTRIGLGVALEAEGAQVAGIADCRLSEEWFAEAPRAAPGRCAVFWDSSSVSFSEAQEKLLGDFGKSGGRLAALVPMTRQTLSAAEERVGCTKLFAKPLRGRQAVAWLLGEGLANAGSTARPAGLRQALDQSGRCRLRLLVAEDNKVNQTVICHQLTYLGHEVVCVAENGLEVLAALRTRDVDVLLLDCQMPEMDGYETARAIRAAEALERGRGRLWVVAITANTMEGDRERCLSCGMDDYVRKPVREKDLEEALARVPVMRAGGAAPGEDRGAFRPGASSVLDAAGHAVVLDPAALERLRELGGDSGEALLGTLVEEFLKSGAGLVEMLVGAGAEFEKARFAAHSLKGSAGNFGAGRLVAACEAVERIAQEGAVEQMPGACQRVVLEFNTARAALLEASPGE